MSAMQAGHRNRRVSDAWSGSEQQRPRMLRARSEGRYLQVAERVHDVYYQTDAAGRVTDVCDAYRSVWLRDVPSLIGHPWFHAVHPEDVERIERAREHMLADGHPFDEEYRILRGDGATHWIRDRAFHFRDNEQIAGVAHDVTDTREVTAGRQHAEKLQTLGMLATSIAHDFGNLIQGVTACLDLALKDSTAQDKARQYMKDARIALRGGAALTRQLTTFSRKDPAAAQALAIDAAVAECVSMLKHLLGAHVDLQIDLRASGSYIWAQPVQIEQILLNLAANARDAMPTGGFFRIQTSQDTDGAAPMLGPRVRLEVVDSGRGMDAETRARIFEPFFTTKPIGEGTGLGLAVVRAVTAALHGELHVESAPACGTGFLFTFPEVPPAERSTAAASKRIATSVAPGTPAPTGATDSESSEGVASQAARQRDDLQGTPRTTGIFRRGTRV